MIQHLLFVAIIGQGTVVPWPDVDFSSGLVIGNSSRVLLESFSRFGMKVTVAGQIGEEIVALECEDLPVREVAQRVAEGLCAEWKFSGDTYVLFRTKRQQDKIESEFTSSIKDNLTKSLSQMEDSFRGMPTPYDRAQSLVTAFRQSGSNLNVQLSQIQPQPILMRQLLVGIGSSTISSLPLDTVVVFSDTPTIFQRQLPKNCKKAIEEYHESEKVLSTVIAEGGVIPAFESWFKAIYDSANEQFPGKCILIVKRSLGSLWATIGTYSGNGKLRGAAALTIPIEVAKPIVRTLPAQETVTPPEDFLELVSAMKGSTAIRQSRMRPKSLVTPDKDDPLEVLTRVVFECTKPKVKSKAVFGVLDDRLAGFAVQATIDRQLNIDLFWDLIHQGGVEQADFDGKWLTIQPQDRFATETRRLDRLALKRFLSVLLNGESHSTRETGLLRANSGYQALREPLFRSYIKSYDAEQTYESAKGTSDSALELIGRLSELQWNELLKGKSIKFIQLSRFAKLSLANWINNTIRAFERPPGTEATIPDQKLTGSELDAVDYLESTIVNLNTRSASLFKMSACPPAFEPFFPYVPMDQSWFKVRIQEMVDGKAITAASDLDAVEGQIGVSNDYLLNATQASGAFATVRFRGELVWQAEKVKLSAIVKN